jgi:hypothetical protein
MSADTRAAKRAALKRATLQLVLGVIVLDSIVLAIYFLADIAHASSKTQMYFTVGWTVVTLAVVLALLKRVRKVRYSR